MWNKLFKKKKSKSTTCVGEAGNRRQKTPACFSFGKNSRRDHNDFYAKSGEESMQLRLLNLIGSITCSPHFCLQFAWFQDIFTRQTRRLRPSGWHCKWTKNRYLGWTHVDEEKTINILCVKKLRKLATCSETSRNKNSRECEEVGFFFVSWGLDDSSLSCEKPVDELSTFYFPAFTVGLDCVLLTFRNENIHELPREIIMRNISIALEHF